MTGGRAIWVDGVIRPGGDALPPDDRGFTLADAAFETIRVADGRPRRLAAHRARLDRCLDQLAIPWRAERDAIAEAVAALCAAEGLTHAAIRLTVTAGSGGRGLDRSDPPQPRAVMTIAPRPTPRPPLAIMPVAAPRRWRADPLAALKTPAAYPAARLARLAARAAGADDAVMSDETGALACAPTANLFWIADGALYTPALSGAVLPGTTRAVVLKAAEAEGLIAHEVAESAEALAAADAAFLTNSLEGVVPARAVWGPARGAPRALDPTHPLITRLADAEAAAD